MLSWNMDWKKMISEFKEKFSRTVILLQRSKLSIAPLTKEAVCRYKDDNNYIRGIVKVELSDMIENDLEDFLI